ncbi:HipA family kinase [Intrasporangium sp.]|uniref:HipA family kinase n=1 Tax=Intrasporangium sp. TaxID=1925024 RepID=UPI00293A842D|nr:HipA family kinase [Intrasporangium sp.]MDV3220103.1 aminotransferase class I and II [Intrasporangium sp.]
MLPQVTATRYVTPLKEGGSLPGIVEASDLGTYVMKFRGAGQGLKVLVAEVIVAGLARAVGVPVPDLAVVALDERIAKYEADEEVQDLLRASVGTNLGVDFLPGSLGYDGSQPPSRDLAERIVWLDAFSANVDRTWANPNLLVWHGQTYAIDHGAALYFHHAWPTKAPSAERFAAQAFDASRHVLRDVAGDVAARHDELRALMTAPVIDAALDDVPDEWLETSPHLGDVGAVRAAYRALLLARLESSAWVPGRAAA